MVGFGGAYSATATTYYRNQLGGATSQIVDASPSNVNSYVKKMDQTNVPGAYAAFNKTT